MPKGHGLHKSFLLLCALGVFLRLVFLLLAGPLEFKADEASYIQLALSLIHFGVYGDGERFLWPPGYPFLLAGWLRGFEMSGLFWAGLFQVFASASVGLSTMLLAARAFDRRAGQIAGALWCVHLPLVGFTHYLRTETLFLALFLPALVQLQAALQEGDGLRERRLLLAGALLGAALHLKESLLYLPLALALLLAVFARGLGPLEGARRASLLLLTLAVVAAPWSLRNLEVYGRFFFLGTSLGENAHVGLNEEYKNYDLRPFTRLYFDEEVPEDRTRRSFVEAEPGSGWERPAAIRNTPDRLAEQVRLGVGYARDHPGWLLRSRIKKLADLVVPFSFFVRHQGLGAYAESILGAEGLRQALVAWALLIPVAVMLLAVPGLLAALRDGPTRWLFAVVLVYFAATSLVNSMSRIRIPMEPLWIALAGGALSAWPAARLGEPRVAVGVGALWALLFFLWWVDWPETVAVIDFAWNPRSPS